MAAARDVVMSGAGGADAVVADLGAGAGAEAHVAAQGDRNATCVKLSFLP